MIDFQGYTVEEVIRSGSAEINISVMEESFPCSDCVMAAECSSGLACPAFRVYSTGRLGSARVGSDCWGDFPRLPSRDTYNKIFKPRSHAR